MVLPLEARADEIRWRTGGLSLGAGEGGTSWEPIRVEVGDADPADAERLKARIPARRFGEPNEVGSAVAFLATNEAAYITGQEILVDGGWSI